MVLPEWQPPSGREVPPPGRTLAGRYTVLEPLGEGGMSVVLAAYDARLDRRVALKLLRMEANPDDANPELRLVREAQAMARLNHPHVVAVYDSGQLEDGSLFIAMEYVEGQTLRQWGKEKPRSWREVLELFQAAGSGLAAAHAAGLIHRDFKPDNVLVGRDGRVRVVDFGVARPVSRPETPPLPVPSPLPPGAWDTELTLPGYVVGTPRYLAPELFTGTPADTRSDLFSFCVALYEALCGQPAFSGPPDRTPVTPPPAHLPTWLMRSVLQGLSIDPARRPASMPVLLKALADDPALRRNARLRRAAMVAMGTAMVALATWGWLRQQGEAPDCSHMERRLEGIWDTRVQQQVRQALESTQLPYASATAERVAAALERYAQSWTRMRSEACKAALEPTELPRGLAVLQEYCLERRRSQLRALTDLLGRGADPELLPRAVEAAQGLPPLEYCTDAQSLTAAVPPPEEPGLRAQVEALQQEVDRLEALYEAGKYSEGMAFGVQLLPRVASVAFPALRARALYQLAQNLEGAGEFKQAETRVREAIPLAAEGRDDALQSRAWGLLTLLVGTRQGRYEEAQGLELITAAAAARTEDPLARAEALNALGTLMNGLDRYDEAQRLFEEALKLWEQVRGPRHPYVAGFRSNLGAALLMRGEYDAARKHLESAQALWEEELGPGHPYLINSLANLGLVHWRLGHLQEALTYLGRTRALVEKVLGPEHPFQAESLSLEGQVLADLGRYTEAEQRQQQALALMKKVLGPEHPSIAEPLLGLGHLRRLQGQASEALPLLEQALKAAQGSTQAEVQFELAQTLWNTRAGHARARELASQAQEYWQRVGHPQRTEVAQWLAAHPAP
ncbi:serine/threonine-protein kinase [Hyalangium versicolor]|uniref:serine/threonine-protein kinase n=1 Tax=Hyalangium versicolor TaxID=2861190 RepID=UPI001CCF8479|nr:serine/threonine-protein kinase [Hyalangium versicolor]